MRSFSFCHFSASSSISMILSCSCSFCSDSSVCGGGAKVREVRWGEEEGKSTRESGNGPTQGAGVGRVGDPALRPSFCKHSLGPQRCQAPCPSPGIQQQLKPYFAVNLGLRGLDIPAVSL